jgi:membrane-bound lytic murein transglycosylase D
MPKRSLISRSKIAEAAKRYGVKAALVVAGVAVAVETADRTEYVQQAPLVQRVVAAAPVKAEPALAASPTVDPKTVLDTGIQHSRITSWVDRLASSAGFKKSLERMTKYDDMILAKLEAKKMPRELIYLAMIESEFNPTARSRVNAVGMWQFMKGTARQFGLKVRGRLDERKDPARSTDAALAYLSDLYDQFGSWYLAAAAYNSGGGTVRKALRRVTGDTKGTDSDFFRILPVLPKETRDYVPKLIAAARVGNDLTASDTAN